jgi:hypothetical protein
VAFKEVLYDLKTEWFQTLNGALSVPVYKDAAPITEEGNYVLIRSEGSTNTDTTNTGFFRSAVIVVDINTQFPVIGNSKVAYDIAQEIDDLILLSPNSFGLLLANHQITQITLQSEDELYEDDNSVKIFRLIKRFEHFLNQK